MSSDKKGFKYRVSNVLACLGAGTVVLTVVNSWDIDLIGAALAFQCFLGVINYLMIGSFRLLPWRDID
jgi:hypothetical protein